MTYYSEEELYHKAKRKVRAKKGFYWHLAVYLCMFVFFFTINMIETPGDPWFFYPMLPWGISLSIHYFAVFGLPGGKMSDKWEEEEIEREMSRQRRLRNNMSTPLDLPEEEEELELRQFKKLRKEWDDKDFV
ncbi:MAG: 2TM domain-containing protein [Saprospiraceae bacterium]